MNINVLIVGVGGQGTLLASRILGKIAENDGSDVKFVVRKIKKLNYRR